jgi:transmembrane sensor
MNIEQQYWDKIAAYLSEQMSSEDRKSFEEWLRASPEHASTFEEAKLVWENSGAKLQVADPETESEWQTLQRKMDAAKSVLWDNMWMKIAASIAVIAVATYGLIVYNLSDDIVVNSGDQVATVYLPDSSRVWLNANSTIRYSEDFGKGERRVSLTGEGYFEARHIPNQDFVVETDDASVKVVGTSFNIREDSSRVILSVEKGKVIFSPADAESHEVLAGERAIVSVDGYEGKTAITDNSYAAWRRVGNPVYELERHQADKFLVVKFSWRKNAINQSVIEGMILNKASLAIYQNVILRVTYANLKGKTKTIDVKLDETVAAGEKIVFTKKLLDIFKDTQHMDVSVKSAQTVE